MSRQLVWPLLEEKDETWMQAWCSGPKSAPVYSIHIFWVKGLQVVAKCCLDRDLLIIIIILMMTYIVALNTQT